MKEFWNLLWEQKNIIGIGVVFLGVVAAWGVGALHDAGHMSETAMWIGLIIVSILWVWIFVWMKNKYM